MNSAKPRTLRVLAENFLCFFTMMLLVTQVAGWFGELHWIPDLFAHFQGEYFLAGAVFLLLALPFRLFGYAVVSLLSLAMSTYALLPLYQTRAASTASPGSPLRIVSLNVLTSNNQYDKVAAFLKQANPDVIFLMEVDSIWIEKLESVISTYPYTMVHARNDNFGVAILSRLPLDPAEKKGFGRSPVPAFISGIHLPKQTLKFIGVHTLPPISAEAAEYRDDVIRGLFDFAKENKGPLIIAGDFNSTRWGHLVRTSLAAGTLYDSAEGFGFQPTWFGGLGLVGVPIDTLLLTPDIAVKSRMIGPDVGSDHRGVIADLAVPDAK